jgi:hypothetical protein
MMSEASRIEAAFGLGIAVLGALFTPRALAAAESDPVSRTTFFTGIELDTEESRRFDVGMEALRGPTRFAFQGSRSDAELGATGYASTFARADLSREIGRYGLGGGLLYLSDEDVVDTLGVNALAFADLSDTRLSAQLDYRSSDLGDSPFTVNGTELGVPLLGNVSGTAACSVDSVGYGLGLRVLRGRASFHGWATLYDYSSYECAATVESVAPGNPSSPRGAILVRRPRLARQLAADVIGRRTGSSARLAPRDATLLESAFTLGASYTLGPRTTLGLEVYRDTEEFAAVESSTLLGYVDLQLTRTAGIEVMLGTTDTDLLDGSVFAGVRLSVSLGR